MKKRESSSECRNIHDYAKMLGNNDDGGDDDYDDGKEKLREEWFVA